MKIKQNIAIFCHECKKRMRFFAKFSVLKCNLNKADNFQKRKCNKNRKEKCLCTKKATYHSYDFQTKALQSKGWLFAIVQI